MFESLLVLASPFVVKMVTDWAKKLGTIPTNDYRVAIIRAIVALLALVSAVLSQVLGEGTVEVGTVETALYALASGGIATWLYLKEKRA